MGKHKTYYIDKRLLFTTKPTKNICIALVEIAVLEACQKRLDEACELLRKTKAIAQQETSILEDQKTIDEIDTFLSQIKDEGE